MLPTLRKLRQRLLREGYLCLRSTPHIQAGFVEKPEDYLRSGAGANYYGKASLIEMEFPEPLISFVR
jgi:hypothetical protein